jgi:predicted CoA-binding protein
MTQAELILATARTVVVVDWPSRDVPDTLARAGYTVLVKGGPEPDSYTAYQVSGGEVVPRRAGAPPDSADLVYVHRPVAELPGTVMLAQRLGAGAIWLQSGLAADGSKDPHGCWLPAAEAQAAREMVESAGLAYLSAPYIADEVRRLGAAPGGGR